MSNTSIRPIPTLRGMFTEPRSVQGRNFLKENKLSLRSLEKATTEKLAAKEPVRPKWMPPLRRTTSDVRDPKRHERGVEKSTEAAYDSRLQRGNSQQQLVNARYGDQNDSYEPYDDGVRCKSCGTRRNAMSIGIQTEDITDELYLASALKKCNFDSKSIISDVRSIQNPMGNDYNDNHGDDEFGELRPLSGRSKSNYYNPNDDIDEIEATIPMTDDQLSTDMKYAEDDEAPLSARSRATIHSNATIKPTKRREHKLGSRDEIRLPRYLEKEKRVRAEAMQRAETRDPDCPHGHVLLDDKERVNRLTSARNRYASLVKELNHMPMTTQTLRVRTRKAEIDKELTIVEDEIRIYSKPKVFVRALHV